MTTSISLRHRPIRRQETPFQRLSTKRLNRRDQLNTGVLPMASARLSKVAAVGKREGRSYRVIRESRVPFIPRSVAVSPTKPLKNHVAKEGVGAVAKPSSYLLKGGNSGKGPYQVMRESRTASVPRLTVASNESQLKKIAVQVDKVGQRSISQIPKPSAWKSSEYMYFAGDLAGTPRLTASLVNTIQGRVNPPGLNALGMTASLSVLTGYVAGCRGSVAYEKAHKIGDQTGKVLGAMNMVRGSVESLGGMTATPLRALSIAGTYTSAKGITVAAGILGPVSSTFFGLTYLLLLIPSAISLVKNILYSHQLNKVMEAPENQTEAQKYAAGLRFLKGSLEGTPEDWEKVALATLKDSSLWEGWNLKEAHLAPEELHLLSAEELHFIEERIGQEKYDMISHLKMVQHTQQAFINMKKCKEVELKRQTGGETVALVKKSGPLLKLLETGKGVEAAKEMFGTIHSEAGKSRLLHGAIILFCALGLFATIAGTVATGGGLPIAIAAIWVITSIGMLAIDGYFLYQAHQSGALDTKDKTMFLIANTLLLIIAGAGTVLSGGLAPLIISGVVGGLWLVLAGYSYYKWNRPSAIEEDTTSLIKRELPHHGEAFILKKKLA